MLINRRLSLRWYPFGHRLPRDRHEIVCAAQNTWSRPDNFRSQTFRVSVRYFQFFRRTTRIMLWFINAPILFRYLYPCVFDNGRLSQWNHVDNDIPAYRFAKTRTNAHHTGNNGRNETHFRTSLQIHVSCVYIIYRHWWNATPYRYVRTSHAAVL